MSKKVMLTLEDQLADLLDSCATARGLKKSAYVATLVTADARRLHADQNPRRRPDTRSQLYIFDGSRAAIDAVPLTPVRLYALLLEMDFGEDELRAAATVPSVLDPDDPSAKLGEDDAAFVAAASKERLAEWLADQEGIADWLVANDDRLVFIGEVDGAYFPEFEFSERTCGIGIGDDSRAVAMAELAEWSNWHRRLT